MISVVTPSFRQLEWLRLCVASVADQEGVEIEQIVQEGGSDGIAENALRPALPNEQYRLQIHVEKDAGMYDAINRGLRRATGEICAYLNCDEQYLPGTGQKVSAFFAAHPEVDVLFGDVILVGESGQPFSYRRAVLPDVEHVRLVHLNTHSCATFFRRQLLGRGFFFDPQWKAIGDTAWVHSLLKAGVAMATIPEPLAIFTFTGKNLGATTLSVEESRKLRGNSPVDLLRRPLAIGTHRLRKMAAGAYARRNVEIEIYTLRSPDRRERLTAHNVGFGWPTR